MTQRGIEPGPPGSKVIAVPNRLRRQAYRKRSKIAYKYLIYSKTLKMTEITYSYWPTVFLPRFTRISKVCLASPSNFGPLDDFYLFQSVETLLAADSFLCNFFCSEFRPPWNEWLRFLALVLFSWWLLFLEDDSSAVDDPTFESLVNLLLESVRSNLAAFWSRVEELRSTFRLGVGIVGSSLSFLEKKQKTELSILVFLCKGKTGFSVLLPSKIQQRI